jgi:hypothetical protein
VAPQESLATNNNETDSSSDNSESEDLGDLLGDSYVDHLGDEMCVKNNNTLRIGFQNVGGFPTSPGKLKEDNTRLGLQKWDFDIFGVAEVRMVGASTYKLGPQQKPASKAVSTIRRNSSLFNKQGGTSSNGKGPRPE